MDWNKKLFNLPLEEKMKVSLGKLCQRIERVQRLTSLESNTWNRGYDRFLSQILEEGTDPDLKESYYIGDDIPKTHPYFIKKKLNSGPNVWPTTLPNVDDFKSTTTEYYSSGVSLAKDILRVLALTLDLEEKFFDDYAENAVATLRLLHYPPQKQDSEAKLTRGIGAHTDFGGITILMQDEVDGLQVWDKDVSDWFDVQPIKGAFVVNLGNLMMRWSNDKYISNLHRVINRSGKERYSIPLFFSGNPDFLIKCLPTCKKEGEEGKYPPVTVEQAVSGGYSDSYGRAQRHQAAQAAAKGKLPLVLATEVAA